MAPTAPARAAPDDETPAADVAGASGPVVAAAPDPAVSPGPGGAEEEPLHLAPAVAVPAIPDAPLRGNLPATTSPSCRTPRTAWPRSCGACGLAISHGANDPRPGRSTFRKEFDWTGTADPTPYLVVPHALDAVAGLVAGGWPSVMARNAAIAVEARRLLAAAAGRPALAPESMLGSMAAVELPPDRGFAGRGPADPDPLAARLRDGAAIEVPVYPWPRDPDRGERRHRLLRVSAHLHNDAGEYEHLAGALRAALAEEER